jgi:hypothetical protein
MIKFLKQLFGANKRERANTPLDIRSVLYRGDLEAKVDALQGLVLDLLREVEALRRTQLDESQAAGLCPKESRYGKIYRDTALLTHNSCGPSDGITKLLELWRQDLPPTRHGGGLSEILMLNRLGFSPAEIDRYVREAEECETYT